MSRLLRFFQRVGAIRGSAFPHDFSVAGYTLAEIAEAFRPGRRSLRFALRTSAAAMLALAIGTLLGFHEAYWAAVTTWVLAIPGRGMVLSKAVYRSVGTLVGAGVALAVFPLAGHPALFLAALSIWVGLCAGIASLFRRFQAYGAQLAGYTATIVAVVALQYPTGPTLYLALERVVLVLIGIASASLLAWLFAKPIATEDLRNHARQWAARVAQRAADILAQPEGSPEAIAPNQDLWLGLSEFDSTCEYAAFESATIRLRLAAIRRLTAAELSLVSAARALFRFGRPTAFATIAPLADHLRRAATCYASGKVPDAEIAWMRATARALLDGPQTDAGSLEAYGIADRVTDIAERLERIGRDLDFLKGEPSRFAPRPLAVHRDWRTSLSVGLRSCVATLVVGLLWLDTGLNGGGYAFIFTAIACTLFGVLPRPAIGLRRFALGIAAAVGLYLLWSLVPGAGALGTVPTLLVVIFWTFIGALGLSNRFAPAMDFNANLLALMLGAGPALVKFGDAVFTGLGLLTGIAVASIAFSLPPNSSAWRARRLDRALTSNLKRLASGDWRPQSHKWETRMYDLLSRSAIADVSAGQSAGALRHCLLAQELGLEILRLRSIVGGSDAPEAVTAIVTRALDDFAGAPSILTAASAVRRAETLLLLTIFAADKDCRGRRAVFQSAATLESIARCCAAWDPAASPAT